MYFSTWFLLLKLFPIRCIGLIGLCVCVRVHAFVSLSVGSQSSTDS